MSHQRNRVVVTGLGITAPNAVGVPDFERAMDGMVSGIRHDAELERLGFGCQIAGTPPVEQAHLDANFTPLQLRGLKASGLVYGVLAGKEAFVDAGLTPAGKGGAMADMGIVYGTGQSGGDKFREAIHLIDDGRVRRLGSTSVIQTMSSGISAWLAGELGLGNMVTSNSSACSTGTEALLMGHERIASGRARLMLVGSTSDSGPYIWGGFDAMRILPTKYNDNPAGASRPMSAASSGFVPSSGAGALVLESLDSALARGAQIYAEVLGGMTNCGGQRAGGTMTAPNPLAVQACIRGALADAQINPAEVDAINGHLTATAMDDAEIKNWCTALDRRGSDFPLLNSFKGVLGHGLAAAGSMELVGCMLQLHHQKIYGNLNLSPIQEEVSDLIHTDHLPTATRPAEIKTLVKASFGFGDVNACVVVGKWDG